METKTAANGAGQVATPATVSNGSAPLATSPHKYASGCECAKCVEQRARWRDKDRRRRGLAPLPANGAAVSPAPSVPNPVAAVPASPGPVPWTADTVRPVWQQSADFVEVRNVKSLCETAKEISPKALELVKEKGKWNVPAKVTLVDAGAETTAKWLNKFGVSAEYAPEVKLGGAIVAIISGQWMLKGELEKIAAEVKAEIAKAKAAKPEAEKGKAPADVKPAT